MNLSLSIIFRREIPHTQQTGGVQLDDLDDSVYCHNHRYCINTLNKGQGSTFSCTGQNSCFFGEKNNIFRVNYKIHIWKFLEVY